MYISRLTLFVLTSVFAVADSWTVQEFCWSVWGAGLFYTWACVFFAVFHCILNARGDWKNRVWNPSFLQAFSPLAYLMTITPVVIVLGYFALRLCIILFEFYGLMLSVFAEMEPHELFGKNGFINSDFFTPVTYLALKFWPMVLGSLAANAEYLFRRASSRKFLVSLQAEILRIHVLIVALPFLTLLVWTAFKASYQSVAVVLLNAIFFLMPGKDADVETAGIDGKQNMKISMSQ